MEIDYIYSLDRVKCEISTEKKKNPHLHRQNPGTSRIQMHQTLSLKGL